MNIETTTLNITIDGSSPWYGNGEIVRDTHENFRVLFARNNFGIKLTSKGWHDYSGTTISVNQFCQRHGLNNAGVITYRELQVVV